ncbi:hypothetical protein VTI74DRAFT_8128 [Chaetomium olivicolor]
MTSSSDPSPVPQPNHLCRAMPVLNHSFFKQRNLDEMPVDPCVADLTLHLPLLAPCWGRSLGLVKTPRMTQALQHVRTPVIEACLSWGPSGFVNFGVALVSQSLRHRCAGPLSSLPGQHATRAPSATACARICYMTVSEEACVAFVVGEENLETSTPGQRAHCVNLR